MEQFKSLKDVKSGYVVKLRNGKLAMAMRCCQNMFLKVLCFEDGVCYEHCYEGLKNRCFRNEDIIEIYGLCTYSTNILYISTDNRPLLWKEHIKEMTFQDVVSELGYEFKLIK